MTIILDTGVGISILPMSFKGVGLPLQRQARTLRDAQGGLMKKENCAKQW